MRCPNCPVAPADPCLGDTHESFAFLCDLATDPANHLHVVNRSLIGAGGVPAPAVAGRPFLRFTKADIAAVNTCLYRECRRGCQLSVCHAGLGDVPTLSGKTESTLAHCIQCLKG